MVSLIGLPVKNATPCPSHPEAHGVIAAGKGPHAYRIQCAECGRFLSWLSKTSARHFERQLEKQG